VRIANYITQYNESINPLKAAEMLSTQKWLYSATFKWLVHKIAASALRDQANYLLVG
jgi:hypothetical protein